MIHPAGVAEQVFTLHGHVWQEEPYISGSTEIGHNPLSQSEGSRDGFGPNISFDAVIEKAGGAAGVTGDYLYRTFIGNLFSLGIWGVFRVGEPERDICTITRFSPTGGKVWIAGVNTVNPSNGHMAKTVTIINTTGGITKVLGEVGVDPMTGVWPFTDGKFAPFGAPSGVKSIRVRSEQKGEVTASNYITNVAEVGGVAQKTGDRPSDERPSELDLFNPPQRRPAKLIQADVIRNESGGATGFQWIVGGPEGKRIPVANDGTISISPGDTIVFSVADGTHGLTFPDGELANRVFRFEMPGTHFEARGKAIASDGVGAGSVIATLTVRKDIPSGITRVPFFCTIHNSSGNRMAATFVITR
jgi:plastocyanin